MSNPKPRNPVKTRMNVSFSERTRGMLEDLARSYDGNMSMCLSQLILRAHDQAHPPLRVAEPPAEYQTKKRG